jgi:hypothetical protein
MNETTVATVQAKQASLSADTTDAPIRWLRCCCCGRETQGRQWHNQDQGFGLGKCCVDFSSARIEDMERTYGTPGVHHSLEGCDN